MKKIYYGKAIYNNKEIKAVNKVLRNNRLNLIDGPHVKKLEKILKQLEKHLKLKYLKILTFHSLYLRVSLMVFSADLMNV